MKNFKYRIATLEILRTCEERVSQISKFEPIRCMVNCEPLEKSEGRPLPLMVLTQKFLKFFVNKFVHWKKLCTKFKYARSVTDWRMIQFYTKHCSMPFKDYRVKYWKLGRKCKQTSISGIYITSMYLMNWWWINRNSIYIFHLIFSLKKKINLWSDLLISRDRIYMKSHFFCNSHGRVRVR